MVNKTIHNGLAQFLEESDAYWTPRSAVRLMANFQFLPVTGRIKSGTDAYSSSGKKLPMLAMATIASMRVIL